VDTAVRLEVGGLGLLVMPEKVQHLPLYRTEPLLLLMLIQVAVVVAPQTL
jgi:hypothetical protein